MNYLKILTLSLAAALMIAGCKKEGSNGDGDTTGTPKNFISFKYKGTECVIEQNGMTSIVTYAESADGIVIYGQSGFKTLSINIYKEIAAGNTYNIYAVTPNSQPDFFIQMSLDMSTTDISLSSNSAIKIGELYISKFANNHISGTFRSKMQNGEITDGKFSATAASDVEYK
jgi:hypothetical protein